MIKFDVLHRFTDTVQFTAEIDCAEDASTSVKMGLAVRWAVKNRANLAGAYLAGAKWRNGIVIQRPPIQIYGLDYPVIILDAHMQIGCELHSVEDWAAFGNERIAEMDGKRARRFWDAHRESILTLARSDGRTGVAIANMEDVA